MQSFYVYLMVLPWLVMSQIPIPYPNQHGSPVVGMINSEQKSVPVNSQISSSSNRNEHYLVGNLSESFTFQVAPSTIKITYLGLNGYSLYITGVGFSNKSKFNFDEQTNRLTIHSLDQTTVGYYSAVDANWKTFTNILSAINVSSFQIHNSHVSEDNNGSSLVSCSVSIIRSTFRLPESKLIGTEYLPRLDLFISTQTPSSVLINKKLYNDSLNEQNFTRLITLQRPLTRADHNGTIQCQIESTNNIDVYLIKTVPIDIEYGPNLETGALPMITLESEVLKMIAMECQIESNPSPSYVWYEMLNNSTTSQNVFGTTRQIQRIYQYPGQYAMQCQAQSRGKTVKQEFLISVVAQMNGLKMNSNLNEIQSSKSNKIPVIIGTIIGIILLLLIIAIIIGVIIYFQRKKTNTNDKHSMNDEKLPNDKIGKSRWGGLPIDYSKYKHESLKTDSSSTSHLVESAETASIQSPPVPPPVPVRPSPMTSTHSSYRQAPSTTVSLSYRQASALPGFRSTNPMNCYDEDDGSTSINVIPLSVNRTRTGSHKSLSESIQSLRSNQQPSISLPMKKRTNDINKSDNKNEYQNLPTKLQINKTDNTSSEDEELEHQQQINQISVPSSDYSQIQRQIISSTSSQLPGTIHHDEAPPSYQQITNTSSPSHAYVYHEPTEV